MDSYRCLTCGSRDTTPDWLCHSTRRFRFGAWCGETCHDAWTLWTTEQQLLSIFGTLELAAYMVALPHTVRDRDPDGQATSHFSFSTKRGTNQTDFYTACPCKHTDHRCPDCSMWSLTIDELAVA